MPSKLVIANQVRAASPDAGVFTEPKVFRGRKRRPEELEPYVEQPFRTKQIDHFKDMEEGLTYAVYARLDPRAGWCLASQLMEELEVPYPVVVGWAISGFLEAAIERGSPTRRFLVRDMGQLRRLAKSWHEEKARREYVENLGKKTEKRKRWRL